MSYEAFSQHDYTNAAPVDKGDPSQFLNEIFNMNQYLENVETPVEVPDHANQPQTSNVPYGYYPAESYQAGYREVDAADNSYNFPQQYPAAQDQTATDGSHALFMGQFEQRRKGSENRADQHPKARQRKSKSKGRVTTTVQDGQPRSKRAEKRAKIIDQYGSVSATDTPKGMTRKINGVLDWWDIEQQSWRLASPLDDHRHQIIAEDNAWDNYERTPESGHGIDDVTTFPINDTLGQKYWDFEARDTFGNIKDEAGNEVMYLLEQPYTNAKNPNSGYMMHNGVIMLDPDDHPIIDWPAIPRCLSSNIEGGRIEAFRRIYPWIAVPQFRARMPRRVLKKTVGWKPLFGLSSLTQRLARFRETMDIPAWKMTHAAKGADLKQHTIARLEEAGLNPSSTATLQPLPRSVIQQRKEIHKGKFPENAGYYTLTKDQRREKAEREARRQEERQVQREARELEESRSKWKGSGAVAVSSGPAIGTKRKRADAATPESSRQSSTKRQRLHSDSAVQPTSFSLPNTSQGPSTASSPTMRGRRNFSSLPVTPMNHDIEQGRDGAQNRSGNDLRYVRPRTLLEQVAIKTALSCTIADYRHFNDEEPPVTRSEDSYIFQYDQIQAHHRNAWYLGGKAPKLIGISEWTGSFRSIPVPDLDERMMQRLLPDSDDDATAVTEPNPAQYQGDDFDKDLEQTSASVQNDIENLGGAPENQVLTSHNNDEVWWQSVVDGSTATQQNISDATNDDYALNNGHTSQNGYENYDGKANNDGFATTDGYEMIDEYVNFVGLFN